MPNALENEQQFDEDNGEWKQTGKEDKLSALCIPGLGRNLAGDRVRLHWMGPRADLFEAIPAANVNKWKLNQQPQDQQRDQCAKRDRSAGRLRPHEEVENEDSGENKAWDECASLSLLASRRAWSAI